MTFQGESKRSGDIFESIVKQDLKNRGFKTITENVLMPGTGCEVDFVADNKEYVEAKGGKSGNGKRPGAKRTDNVKKAIANAALIKHKYPDIYYVVYFSAKPDPGSYSEQMILTGLDANLLDEVRYISGNKSPSEQMALFEVEAIYKDAERK
jgi:hypothetical protein